MSKTIERNAKEATQLFNQISGATYFALHFHSVLTENDAARKAAQALVDALREAGVKGMD